VPRKLRKEKRRTELSLDTFTAMELLAFTVAWSPPVDDTDRRRFPRWQTWEAYFRDYDTIRPLLIVSDYHKPGAVLFADTARAALAAAKKGEVWAKHTHKALLHSHLYTHGDAHVHDDDARLGPAEEIEVNA
jgi:hypothetical protein